jgi:hypothetical protein
VRTGVPLSEARIRNAKVPGPSVSEGIHSKRPVTGSMTAPAGASAPSEYRTCWPASGSTAETMNTTGSCSGTLIGASGAMTGGRLPPASTLD